MGKVFDVIGVENMIMDFAVQINRLPKTDGISRIFDYSWGCGGNAGSAIVALARMGARCGMLGTTGSDRFGDFCKEDMARHGVDVSHIWQTQGDTTFCICLAEKETQGRSILGKIGNAPSLTPEQVDGEYIASARAIHVALPFSGATRAAIDLARRQGVLVSADAGGPVDYAMDVVKCSDILIMSESFYGALFQDTEYEKNCRSLLAFGPSVAIVTLGSKGCAGANKDGSFTLESFSNAGYEIADTTGAGDVFHGGFLYAWLERYQKPGWNYTLKDCARFASAVSYINCLTLGGRTGIPTLEMVDTFLKTGMVETSQLDERRNFYKTAMFK